MIQTDRLLLTPMGLEDAPFVFDLVNTKEYVENIGKRRVESIFDAEEYIKQKMILHYEKHGYGNYLMTRKEDKKKIGCVSLYNREDVEGVDIGFALLPQYFRNGYAYEGAKLLMEEGKNKFGLTSICAFTSKDNLPSQGLIMKLGLTFKKTILFGEKQEELLYYSLEY